MTENQDGIAWLAAWRLAIEHSHGWAKQGLPRLQVVGDDGQVVPDWQERAAAATAVAEAAILGGGENTAWRWYGDAAHAAGGIAPMQPAMEHVTATGRVRWSITPWEDERARVIIEIWRPAVAGLGGHVVVARCHVYAGVEAGRICALKTSPDLTGPGALHERHLVALADCLSALRVPDLRERINEIHALPDFDGSTP